MVGNYGTANNVYTATDAWSMAQYGANQAATFTPVRRIDEPVSTVGPWLGNARKIFFLRVYRDEIRDEYETKYNPLFKLANQSDLLSSD